MSKSIYTEYTNLTDEHKTWLDECGATWGSGSPFKYVETYYPYLVFDKGKFSNSFGGNHYPGWDTLTHIPTGSEFCEQVAEILGIKKPRFASDLKYKLVKKLEMHDRMERPLPEMNDQNDHTESHLKTTYPHRTYRVLDSLDGIPLDKRIPLSEWIPPFDTNVLFVMKDYYAMGRLWQIKEGYVCLSGDIAERYKTLSKSLDGHWMRIV